LYQDTSHTCMIQRRKFLYNGPIKA